MTKKIVVFLLGFFLFLGLPFMTMASGLETAENSFLPKDRVVNYNYFKAGSTIDISGTVEKDAYAAGQVITVDGVIKGDLIGVGSTLRINGTVEGNVRFAGENLVINGIVGKNVMLAGSNMTIGPDAKIGWELLAAGQVIDVQGRVGGNMNLSGVTITVNNEINGRFDVEAETLTLGEKAKINGDMTYHSETNLIKKEGAVIVGNVEKLAARERRMEPGNNWSAKIGGSIFSYLSALLLAVILLLVFPKGVQSVANEISGNFGVSFGIGLLFLFFLPLAAMIVLITIIGIPLSILSFVLYVVVIYLSKIFFSLAIIHWVRQVFKIKHEWNAMLAAVVGLLIFTVIRLIPVIGFLLGLVAIASTMGALFMVKKKQLLSK
jgi:cytoskeletal protein CcmA (bactofilin family)